MSRDGPDGKIRTAGAGRHICLRGDAAKTPAKNGIKQLAGVPRSDLSTSPWRVGAVLPPVADERMSIGRLMLARAAASAAVRRSATKSPGTFAGEWRPRPSEKRRTNSYACAGSCFMRQRTCRLCPPRAAAMSSRSRPIQSHARKKREPSNASAAIPGRKRKVSSFDNSSIPLQRRSDDSTGTV
jgi:hypothetical protein